MPTAGLAATVRAVRVLVTGATGFIGRAIVETLLGRGHEVNAAVRARDSAAARALAERGASLFEAELGDPSALAAAAAECEVVVHAAGRHDDRASHEALGWLHVAGTENLLRAARHVGVRRVVAIGSSDVTLHRGSRVGWSEDRTLMKPPVGVVGRTKLEAEELIIGAGADLEVVVLRPGRVWGPGDTTWLPALAREGLAGGVRLFGPGTSLVPTTYVGNLAQSVALALDAPGATGMAIYVVDAELNLASELFGALSTLLGVPAPRTSALGSRLALPWTRRDVPLAEVLRRAHSASFTTTRAHEHLGFAPPVSLAEGLAALSNWVEAQGGAKGLGSFGASRPDYSS